MKKNTLVVSLKTTRHNLRQNGINMVDLMMWIVIAAILLAAAIQGVGYYRESVILYYLKNDAIGAAANVKSSSAQDEGVITQAVVDTGLANTRWTEGTTHAGKANDRSVYSVTASNAEITRSVVYCSIGGISVVKNVDLPSFVCGPTVVAAPPVGGGTGGGGDGGDGITPAKTVLAGWGDMSKYQLGVGPWQDIITRGPFYGKIVKNIAVAINTDACALADNVLYCWRPGVQNDVRSMQTTGALVGKTVTRVSANYSNNCVVASGKAYCWGDNSTGQLGNGTSTGSTTSPTEVSGGDLAGKTVVDIKVAPYHTCAVDDAGNLYCWGKNQFGQLGISSQVNALTPKLVTGGLSGRVVKEVSVTEDGSCALDSVGYVYCWGMSGVTGTYGTGTNSPGSTKEFEWKPVRVANSGIVSGKTFTTVNATRTGACAVSAGTQYCWGLIENGTVTSAMNAPRVVMNGIPAGQTVIESDDYCVRLSGGTAYCHYYTYSSTGYVRMGGTDTSPLSDSPIQEMDIDACIISKDQPWCHTGFGIGSQQVVSYDTSTPDKIAESPVDISSAGIMNGKNVTLVGGGLDHSCAVADDELYCFGANTFGQLGNGVISSEEKFPVKVTGLPAGAVKSLAVGDKSTCALVGTEVYCWGLGTNGFLGNGAWSNSVNPIKVSGLGGKTIVTLIPGDQSVCATDTTKALYCWGNNDDGQLGNGTFDSSNVPVAVPAFAGKNVTDVSSSGSGYCAVVDSLPYCWGENWYQQLNGSNWNGVPSPKALAMTNGLSGKTVTSIVTTESSYCATGSDSNVYCWGANATGEFGDGTTSTASGYPQYDPQAVSLPGGVTQLVAGIYHLCALSGGSVYCWGDSYYGQLGSGVVNDSSYVPMAITTSGPLSGKTVTGLYRGSMGGFVTYK